MVVMLKYSTTMKSTHATEDISCKNYMLNNHKINEDIWEANANEVQKTHIYLNLDTESNITIFTCQSGLRR